MVLWAHKTILVVEDDPDLRAFYRAALTAARYTVVAVEDGIDALRRIEADPPDLVILDMTLPRLGGRDVQQELASHSHTRSIPILVVTGTNTPDLDPTACACVLHKPVTAEALIAAVDECLGRTTSWTPRRRDRRVSLRCISCGVDTIMRETTIQGERVMHTWRCSACDARWPERRMAG